MYLVVECSTMSAPSVSGCCRHGEAKVLSTTRQSPRAVGDSWAIAAMSAMDSSGLVGVSTQISLVSAVMAARTASRSDSGDRRVVDAPAA